MFFWAKLIALGIAVAVVIGLYARYESVIRTNEDLKLSVAQLEQAAKEQTQAFEGMRAEYKNLDRLLATQAKRAAAMVEQFNLVRGDLNDLKGRVAEVRAWAESNLPSDIVARLRDNGTDSGKAAGKADGPRSPADKVPDPKVLGHD